MRSSEIRYARAASRLSTFFLSALGLGCATAAQWSQFHADEPNRGLLLVHSTFALQPKWSASVGPVSFSSPVVGPSGTVYIGTTHGELVAVNPDGTLKWKIPFPSSGIHSSPAVGEREAIYVITTTLKDDGSPEGSVLQSVDPAGTVNWSAPFPDHEITLASPKLWRSGTRQYVLIYARWGPTTHELLVYNQAVGGDKAPNLMRRGRLCNDLEVSGGGGFDGGTISGGTYAPSWPDPTVAVVEKRGMPNQPTVVVVDRDCGVFAFQFLVASLTPLWKVDLPKSHYSSPGVNSSMVAVGGEDGTLHGYSVNDGSEQWSYDLGDAIIATPSVIGIQAFAATRKRFSVVDFNGVLLHDFTLPNITGASPALSADQAYLSTTAGLFSFTQDFATYTVDTNAKSFGSSPAVAADGTVYAVSSADGLLRAYPASLR